MRKFLVGVVFPAVLLAAAPAAGQPGLGQGRGHGSMQGPGGGMGGGMDGGMQGRMGGGRMMGMAHPILMNADELGLTDEQVGRITRLQRRNAQSHQTMMQTMHGAMMQIRMALMNPKATDADVKRAGKAYQDAFEKTVQAQWEEREAILKVLTAPQRKKFEAMEFDSGADAE